MSRGGPRQGTPGATYVTLSDGRSVTSRALAMYVVEDEGCWRWTGSRDAQGYGKISTVSDAGKRSSTNAHRAMYEARVGAVDKGMVVDHLCRNTSCVNPAHLQPVSNGVNVTRGVWATRPTCPQGHPFTSENFIYQDGTRRCRACLRNRDAAFKRGWRRRNPERLKATNAKYYAANREKLRARQAEYYAATRRKELTNV